MLGRLPYWVSAPRSLYFIGAGGSAQAVLQSSAFHVLTGIHFPRLGNHVLRGVRRDQRTTSSRCRPRGRSRHCNPLVLTEDILDIRPKIISGSSSLMRNKQTIFTCRLCVADMTSAALSSEFATWKSIGVRIFRSAWKVSNRNDVRSDGSD